MQTKALRERVIIIRGAGEMATGVACRLFRANFRRILMLETASPLAVRRRVSFCEAVHEQRMTVEGIEAVRVSGEAELHAAWEAGRIAVMVDPRGESIRLYRPDVLIDATLAKRNLGTAIADAPLVIALGPGFLAGRDCHVVVETNRGHDLGRLITEGEAEADTGIPGDIGGHTRERVLRAPADGLFTSARQIGEPVRQGELIGRVGEAEVTARIDGVLRGLIRPDSMVGKGLKIGDIDPRGEAGFCDTISEKARALGGAVLEAVLAVYNRG
ncbi:MAG: selenium-dependent molybdenum cofactor biosynthesis protein YqeB [Geobacteraceae bacterium]|nr:selenium-dependent molybdenum cofactor biosynthesis protein YqeB [Geobacteraceae bacterium]